MASENFAEHKCDLELKECRTIPVVYFQDDSYRDKKLMTGMGIDGVLYTFEVVPREPIPYVMPLSDDFLQRKKSDKDFTEPSVIHHKLLMATPSFLMFF